MQQKVMRFIFEGFRLDTRETKRQTRSSKRGFSISTFGSKRGN